MSLRIPRHVTATLLGGLGLLVGGVGAQSSYTLQRIEKPAEAYSLVAIGMNELGHVVGWSQFFDGGPSLRGWVWTPETGVRYLPQPPGIDHWGATGINDAGIICGDGGYDFGQAWRWDGTSYEMLGNLPNGNMSTAAAITSDGTVLATSRDAGSFLVPPSAFVAEPGQPNLEVVPGGWATFGNDAGQVVGYASNKAYLYSPGSGVEFLGPLGSKTLTWAWGVNASGVVVGEAAAANGNGHVPFVYDAAGGMQEIGTFGGSAGAAAINDAGVVVGNFNLSSGGHPWRWTADEGVVFFDDLLGLVDGLDMQTVVRITEGGQVLMRATDTLVGGFVDVVLTPVVEPRPWADLGSSLAGTLGAPSLQGVGALEAGGSLSLDLTGAPASSTTFLVLGLERVDVPFKGGTLVPAFAAPAGMFLTLSTDGSGSLGLTTPLPGDLPLGLQLTVQAWVVDAGAPYGLAASNAVQS